MTRAVVTRVYWLTPTGAMPAKCSPLPPRCDIHADMYDQARPPEERQYLRLPCEMAVDYQFLSDSFEPLDAEIRTGVTREMNAAGLCLRVSRLPDVLDQALDGPRRLPIIGVDIHLPTRRLRILGQVVWTKVLDELDHARLIGIEYLNLRPDEQRDIAESTKRVARQPRAAKAVLACLACLVVICSGALAWSRLAHQRKVESLRE
ncbi:hypothetical protein ACFL6C_08735, partial [Myxococcota bacterium]